MKMARDSPPFGSPEKTIRSLPFQKIPEMSESKDRASESSLPVLRSNNISVSRLSTGVRKATYFPSGDSLGCTISELWKKLSTGICFAGAAGVVAAVRTAANQAKPMT